MHPCNVILSRQLFRLKLNRAIFIARLFAVQGHARRFVVDRQTRQPRNGFVGSVVVFVVSDDNPGRVKSDQVNVGDS